MIDISIGSWDEKFDYESSHRLEWYCEAPTLQRFSDSTDLAASYIQKTQSNF